VSTDATANVADPARTDVRPIAPVAAVKANVLSTLLLPVMTFTAAISCLIPSGRWPSQVVETIKFCECERRANVRAKALLKEKSDGRGEVAFRCRSEPITSHL